MIRLECPGCGTVLKGPDESAGKKIKCPKCATSIQVPAKVYEAEPLVSDDDLPPEGAYDLEGPSSRNPYAPPSEEEGRKPCPICGEMIVAGAAKCRFCGEILDPKLKKANAKVKKKKKARVSNSDDDDLTGTDMVLCLLCPGIACIASVVYMIQGKGKGLKVFGLSVVGNIIWAVIRVAIESANQQGGP